MISNLSWLIPGTSAHEYEAVNSRKGYCASKYCSTKTLSKKEPPPVKLQRSSEPAFDFKKSCIYCQVKRNPKHPDRWRAAYLVEALETNVKRI